MRYICKLLQSLVIAPSLAFSLFTLLARQRLAGLSKTVVTLLFQFLSQRVTYLFIYFPTLLFRSRCQKMSAGTLGGFKNCLCVPQMDCASSQRALFSRITFVPIQKNFFFVFLWRTVSPSVLVLLFFLLFLNSALLPLLNFAGPCRRWGRRTRAFTPSPCISKESESAVAKAQGE